MSRGITANDLDINFRFKYDGSDWYELIDFDESGNVKIMVYDDGAPDAALPTFWLPVQAVTAILNDPRAEVKL